MRVRGVSINKFIVREIKKEFFLSIIISLNHAIISIQIIRIQPKLIWFTQHETLNKKDYKTRAGIKVSSSDNRSADLPFKPPDHYINYIYAIREIK
jgi:hypothetical protein